jgi:uncharacterized protein
MNKERVSLRLFNNASQIATAKPIQKAELSDNAQSAGDEGAESRVMQGYATLYDVRTDLYWYTLSIDKAAFNESLARPDDVVSLFNHDWNYVLGRLPDTLKIDASHEYGLWQETILPNHDLGNRILEDIKRKALTQMSVAFLIDEYVYTEGKSKEELGNYHVTKATLQDVSAVTFGQYPETTLEIKKLYAQPQSKEVFQKLLSQSMEQNQVDESITRALEVRRLYNKLKNRKGQGYSLI